jgi:hypothetical protein
MSESLNCPFCNAEAGNGYDGDLDAPYWCGCVNDGCPGYPGATADTPEEALRRWNTRPASATAVEVTEELVRTAMAKAFGVDAICQPGWTPQKAMYQALSAGLGKGRRHV